MLVQKYIGTYSFSDRLFLNKLVEVTATNGDQLLECPRFNNLALLEHYDFVWKYINI